MLLEPKISVRTSVMAKAHCVQSGSLSQRLFHTADSETSAAMRENRASVNKELRIL